MPEVLLQVRPDGNKNAGEIFEIAERSGYDGIELDCAAKVDLEDLYVRSVDYNLPVKSILAPTLNFYSPMRYLLEGDTGTHQAYKVFKPQQVVFRVPNSPVLRDLSCYLFKDRLRYFKGLYGGSSLFIENSAPSGSLGMPPILDLKQIRDLAYELDVFINFDVANCAASGKDILQSYDMLAPRIRSVHISDHASGKSHLVPGSGQLPLGMLLSKMKAFKFNGTFILELDQKELAGQDSGDTMVLYKELIGYVKSYF